MVIKVTKPPQSLHELMAFTKEWRPYQRRLLGGLDGYLKKQRLHLVAAPGSGKTVLGLEVVRRINSATLILAPTITIRDQWVDRLIDFFLPSGTARPGWVSTDLKAPALLTVATYQALHAACSGTAAEEYSESADSNESEIDDTAVSYAHSSIPESLKNAEFRTLVLDEAHHLRAEWWKDLTSFVEQMQKPTIVALTATPPYDVSLSEWQRYEQLCGPIDAEVSVPELVQAGDLCPHQNYVYFSAPTQRVQQVLSDFRNSVDQFVRRLIANTSFADAIVRHPWVSASAQHAEEILEDPEFLSSMAIYLNASGRRVPPAVLHTLGIARKRIPPLDLQWLEVLLSRCLYSEAAGFHQIEPLLKDLRHELAGIGALERGKVSLRTRADQAALMTASTTKLKSIEEIVRREASSLGAGLRCVILTDFIRKTELPTSTDKLSEFKDIGIVPVFESLRRSMIPNARLGVLSGSLVVVPSDAEPLVRDTAATIGIAAADLAITPLAHDASYSSVALYGEYHEGYVRLITAVFERGGVTVLVGTKSLLGEGWDAPCINTLVLASFVGSFVLSNQMRGRAIRVDAKQPEKTANIWHLVCVEPGRREPGPDYDLLVRRCACFVGVSANGDAIENGIDRLGFGKPPFSVENLVQMNESTFARALDRDGLRQKWQDALSHGVIKQMAHGVKAASAALPRRLVFSNTITALVIQAIDIGLTILYFGGRFVPRNSKSWLPIAVLFGCGLLATVALTVRALWRLVRHGTPERSIKQIGQAVLEALQHERSIGGKDAAFELHAERKSDGTVFCWLEGGTSAEQELFIRAMRTILRPIENPRYLLARRKIMTFFREDYFSVPDVLARKKEYAEDFARRWGARVEPISLVYTRTPEGRAVLLRARNHALSAVFQDPTERITCWK